MFTAAAPPLNSRVEFLKLATYLPSPPSSPSLPPSDPTFSVHPFNPARLACPSPSLTARISRVHKTPYPTIGQRQYTLSKMSQGPYATWPAGVKTEHEQFSGSSQGSMTASRRSGSSDHQQAASFAYGSYPQVREIGISPTLGRGMLMIHTCRARLTAVYNHALGCVGIPVRPLVCPVLWAMRRLAFNLVSLLPHLPDSHHGRPLPPQPRCLERPS